MSGCNQPAGQLGNELVSCHPSHTCCQLPAPTDVGSSVTNASMLRGPSHPLLREGNQTQKETQRMGEGKAEDCWGCSCFPHESRSCREHCHPLGVGPFGNPASALHSVWGLGWRTAGMASKQGPLPGAAEALLGHRLHELSSCSFNLSGVLH